jgi:hypothetical protein
MGILSELGVGRVWVLVVSGVFSIHIVFSVEGRVGIVFEERIFIRFH